MPFFQQGSNDVGFADGYKHFLNIIKNESGGDYLLWLNPAEDFNTGSTLVVAENEDALFFNNGVIEQVFSGGSFLLTTENYPFISGLRTIFSGGASAFNCKVYFVRKSDSREIFWGTDSPIQAIDPVYQIPVSVQARGSYRVRVVDSKKFLMTMVGDGVSAFSQEDIEEFCHNQFAGYIKSTIGKAIKASKETVVGICSEQEEFAELIAPKVQAVFEPYGLQLINFSISGLDVPTDDPYFARLQNAMIDNRVQYAMGHTENALHAENIAMTADAQEHAFEVLGENWGRQQSADILGTVAANPNSGGIAAAGAGLGMGFAAGGAIGAMAQTLVTDPSGLGADKPFGVSAPTAQTAPSSRFMRKKSMPESAAPSTTSTSAPAAAPQTLGTQQVMTVCPNCGAAIPTDARFCSNCGKPISASTTCKSCGATLAPGSKFCHVCGAPQDME